MVKKGSFSKLIAKLTKTVMVELVSEHPKEVKGLFGVQTDGDLKMLIVDARRANLMFTIPEDLELTHSKYYNKRL